jgi:hypothetical protein
MVYTRSQKVEVLNAAQALLSLKKYTVTLGDYLTMTKARYSNWAETPKVVEVPKALEVPKAKSKLSQKLWSNWSIWYDSFVAEVEDEGRVKTASATERWTTFAARSLHCSEAEVRSWLVKAKPC